MHQISGHDRADVIVIGAGHNGLTAACYLQKAGRDVLVLEASPTVGGMLGTNALFPGAPGHLHNEGGIQASLFRATTIEADLDLRRYGFAQLDADPYHVHLEPEGASLAFWRDPRRTAAEMERFSRRDAAAFLEFAALLDSALDLMLPLLVGHPTRPEPRVLLRQLPVAVRRRKDVGALIRFFAGGHRELIEELFDHPLVRAAMASMPPFCWMTQDGTGWALIYLGICHRTGSSRFEGGSGALPRALHACLEDHGGRVRTSAPVAEIVVRGGGVAGVRLESGEQIDAATVMASCSPKKTLNELLPAGSLPERLERRAAQIPTTSTGAANLKIDVAVSGRLSLPRHEAWREDGLDLRRPIVSWHSYEEHLEAWDDAVAGRWPQRIPFIGIAPSAIDPSQAPDGQDTFWLWSGIVPSKPDQPWETVRDEIGRRVLADAADYYEGLDRLEIDRRVFCAPDLAERFNVPDGNVYHVDPFMLRFGPLRPAPGLGSYDTPVPGLFLTGAGTHPTGGISGIPGQQAAKRLLRLQRRGEGVGSRVRGRVAAGR
ncbi:phytoene desaturase family protein [Patulibacter defluvii]|uniref:phytoene desaturase family protein n=1 Tax=Patulibacter defluvii TaxID=3095358 RepID=UPI002A75FF61|nr:NAD(P)/FAD-dependent oxidoreductase [Patulibacter sp. DM4]